MTWQVGLCIAALIFGLAVIVGGNMWALREPHDSALLDAAVEFDKRLGS
jgi:hypothetical protein